MTCDFQKDKLSGYFDGELPEAERGEVERHIAGCSECLRELGELKATVNQLQGLARFKAPPSVGTEVARGITGGTGRVRRWLRLSVAAAAVGLFAMSVVVIGRQERRVSDRPVAATPQAEERTVEKGRKQKEDKPTFGFTSKEADLAGRDMLEARDENRKLDAKPAEPYVLVVSGLPPAQARAETEAVLKDFNATLAEGAGEQGESGFTVELTDAQIETLKKRLEEKQARVAEANLADEEGPLALRKAEAPSAKAVQENKAKKIAAKPGDSRSRNEESRAEGPEGEKAADPEKPAAQAAEAAKQQEAPSAPAAEPLLRHREYQAAAPARRKVILRFEEAKVEAAPAKK